MRHLLAVRLPAVVVTSVVLAIALATGTAVLTGRHVLRQQAVQATDRQLDAYLAGVQGYLAQARDVLRVSAAQLGAPPSGGGPATEDVGASLRVADDVLRSSAVFDELMLLAVDGRPLMIRPDAQAGLRESFGDRPWFVTALSGRLATSDLELSPSTGQLTVVLAMPLRAEDGSVASIWAGGIRLEELSRLGTVPGSRSSRQAHGYVTDSHGLVIAHQAELAYVRAQTDFSTVPSVRRALSGARFSGFMWNPIERQQKVTSAAPLPGTGWAVVFGIPEAVALESVTRMTSRLVQLGVVAALVFAVASALLVRRMISPLRDLRRAASVIATGDLAGRVEVRRNDELGQLGAEFNRMANALAAKDQSLHAHAEQLELAVSELADLVAERDNALAELESFSYSVSHDLRAPLRAVSGFTEAALQDSPGLSDESRRNLQRSVKAAERMGRLIEDMLRLSRVSRAPLHNAVVDVTAMAEEITEELRGEDPERLVTLYLAPDMVVRADPALLHIALQNLLDNAWKFTRDAARPRIVVNLHDHGDGPVISVRDNGVGFDATYADKLFTPFQRLHAQKDFPGTGIGLAIVARVASRHRGRATARCNRGAGAEFQLHLPQSCRATRSAPPERELIGSSR